MTLSIRNSRKNILFLTSTRVLLFFCFSDTTDVIHGSHDGGSPIPANVDPTAYDLIMLDVDDILPSPLTALELPPPVPEPVCEMQTLALITMDQASPRPQSVDSATYACVNPLPLPATSSLST